MLCVTAVISVVQELKTGIIPRIRSAVSAVHSQLDGLYLLSTYSSCLDIVVVFVVF